jgi:AcrR family transcriptional regulator
VEHKAPRQDAGRRRYPRREAAAARTRVALVGAAHELFVERGYLSTTVGGIAQRAGVGRATVFTSVPGGKPELLKLARDVALAGDDEPVSVPQRAGFLEAMAAEDPHEVVRLQARNYRMILERAADLEQALVVGAAATTELVELLEQARAQRAAGTRFVVDRLVQLGAVSSASASRAADTVYALAGADVYHLLVRDRGWSAAEHERWLHATLVATVLDPADPSPHE